MLLDDDCGGIKDVPDWYYRDTNRDYRWYCLCDFPTSCRELGRIRKGDLRGDAGRLCSSGNFGFYGHAVSSSIGQFSFHLCCSLCRIAQLLLLVICINLALLAAVFHIRPGCGEKSSAVSTVAIPSSAFSDPVPMSLAAAFFAAVHGGWILGFKRLAAAFAFQRIQPTRHKLTGFELAVALPAAQALLPQTFLFCNFLRGQLRLRKINAPDEFEVNLNLLYAVTVDLLRRVDDDLVNKLIDHGRG